MIAILGGLGAAAAWALSTLCSSRSSRLIDPSSVVAWMMLVGLLITVPLAALSGVPARLGPGSGAWLAVSGAGNVGGLVLTYRALRVGQVTLVAPLVSTEGAVAAVIALIAGEPLAPGVGVTLAAIVGRGVGGLRPGSLAHDARTAPHPTYAISLAIAAALAFGVSLYATARAGAELPVSWVVLSARAIGVVTLALPLALTRRLEITRPAVPLVVASGICEVLGFYSYTIGSRHGIAVAAVLASQVGGLAALGAYFAFGERLQPHARRVHDARRRGGAQRACGRWGSAASGARRSATRSSSRSSPPTPTSRTTSGNPSRSAARSAAQRAWPASAAGPATSRACNYGSSPRAARGSGPARARATPCARTSGPGSRSGSTCPAPPPGRRATSARANTS